MFYNVKIDSNNFSSSEKDLLEWIDYLASTHKLTRCVTGLLKTAYDEYSQPNSKLNNKQETYLDNLDSGITERRKSHNSEIKKKTDEMQKKIDKIYEMAYETYLLALVGKKAGLIEEQSENLLSTTFLLERQLSELQSAAGTMDSSQVFESNKIEDTKERAEKVVELIIKSYSGIIGEVKQQKVIVEPKEEVLKPKTSSVSAKTNVVSDIKDENKKDEDYENQIVDFGDDPNSNDGYNENMADLEKFLGR